MTRLTLKLGPFTTALATDIPGLVADLQSLYPSEAFRPAGGFADFHVALRRGRGLRRWWRPQVDFLLDGEAPFKPLPLDQALPMFEWGINYAIAALAQTYLIIHAAALEHGGKVVILPGSPGAGKSTLAAALAHRGWRLLSDELALIRPADRHIVPLARPVSLKNQSIGIIRQFAPAARFSRETQDTAKGTVALMAAPPDSIARVAETAPAGWIVFPRWQAGAATWLAPFSKAAALVEVAHNALNYSMHGAAGFELLAALFDDCGCYRFTYGALDDAVAAFKALAEGRVDAARPDLPRAASS